MKRLLNITVVVFILLSSCADPKAKNDTNKATQVENDTFVPDKFEDRSDTASLNVDKGKLLDKTQTLFLSYAVIGCTCANWFETKYANDVNSSRLLFLEPANDTLVYADTLFDGENIPVNIVVEGQFYKNEGFPKNYRPAKGNPQPARVFRYNKIEFLNLKTPIKTNGI